MPRYRFTGAYERTFLGLSHGVNATTDPPGVEGSTVTLTPGAAVDTTDQYEHAELAPDTAPVKRARTDNTPGE